MSDPRLPRRPVLKPSEWSPRPIPQPVPELRTADPPTPTLKELAARERQRAALATTWIGVRLLTPDGLPFAGGEYSLTANDGRGHGGDADAEGRGRVEPLAPGDCTVWAEAVVRSARAPATDDAPWPPIAGAIDAPEPEDHATGLGGRAALVTHAIDGDVGAADVAGVGSAADGNGNFEEG